MTEQDTREKLVKDVRKYANPSGGKGTLGACWEQRMFEFLDSQAAITEREYNRKLIAEQVRSAWMKSDMCKLQAERDEWKTKCETREVAYKQADAERNRYSEQIDELQAERDDYKASMETLEANANLWHEQADKLKAENERLSDRINGLLLELLIIAEKLGG